MATHRRTEPAPGLVALGPQSPRGAQLGRVALVGGGPGDPELLTVKAVRLIREADVIVHDGLVSQAVLDLAPAATRRISVAKRRSTHTYAQADIEKLLIAFAREGLAVVRLKGGDPFVFGRGGEELIACREAGVPCEVVPGISAALAASASSGAPLTHRRMAQAVTFVTGHGGDGAAPDLDWASLARPNQTVVIYMGLATAGQIAKGLMDAGRSPATPALIVENASRPEERRILTSVDRLAVDSVGVRGPALLMVGEAMALAHAHEPLDQHAFLAAPRDADSAPSAVRAVR